MNNALKVEKDCSDGIVYRVVTAESAVVMAECQSLEFAQKIAALPELLEALEDCLLFIEKRHGYMSQKAQQARAAIAKAGVTC